MHDFTYLKVTPANSQIETETTDIFTTTKKFKLLLDVAPVQISAFVRFHEVNTVLGYTSRGTVFFASVLFLFQVSSVSVCKNID